MTQNFQPIINIHVPAAAPTKDTMSVELSPEHTGADTATGSADALKNAERAWLEVKVEGFETGADIILENHGRTPALIKEVYAREDYVESIQELGVNPEGGEPLLSVREKLVAPGKPFSIRIGVTVDRSSRPIIPVFVWGIVRYKDVYDRLWHTRFCYRCKPLMHSDQPLFFEKIAHNYYNSYGKG
jgi:hypothetical protein